MLTNTTRGNYQLASTGQRVFGRLSRFHGVHPEAVGDNCEARARLSLESILGPTHCERVAPPREGLMTFDHLELFSTNVPNS